MRPKPSSRVRPLHLPTPAGSLREPAAVPGSRARPKRRRPFAPLRQLAIGVLCVAAAGVLLKGLMELVKRLDTLLLVSQGVANLIHGLALLGTGLLQMLALAAVAAMALLSLLLLTGGLTRLLRLLGLILAGSGGNGIAAPNPARTPAKREGQLAPRR
ncbi:MAG: hypothetical protein ACK6BG_00190 [Cyanobacteriota bacterium]